MVTLPGAGTLPPSELLWRCFSANVLYKCTDKSRFFISFRAVRASISPRFMSCHVEGGPCQRFGRSLSEPDEPEVSYSSAESASILKVAHTSIFKWNSQSDYGL